jgi:hypothetical protein
MHFNNLIKFPGLAWRVYRNLKVQKHFIKQTLVQDIEQSKKENDNSLNDSDFRKITNYYGFAVPAIMGEGFCLLRGKSLTKGERSALTYLGALTGLFDDFFDKKELAEHYLKNLTDNPETAETSDANERLFVRFAQKALKNTFNPNVLKQAAKMVYDAQILSKKQADETINQEEIKDITLKKGGYSILFYRSAFQQPAGDDEKEMLYHLGGIGQLENDIFDIYKDSVSGIKTLATTTKKIQELRETYTSLMQKTFQLVHETDFSSKNKKKFLRFVALIVARGFVCLDFLEKNEKKTNNTFSLKDYNRQDLVCDMGTTKNNLKLLAYYLKSNIGK